MCSLYHPTSFIPLNASLLKLNQQNQRVVFEITLLDACLSQCSYSKASVHAQTRSEQVPGMFGSATKRARMHSRWNQRTSRTPDDTRILQESRVVEDGRACFHVPRFRGFLADFPHYLMRQKCGCLCFAHTCKIAFAPTLISAQFWLRVLQWNRWATERLVTSSGLFGIPIRSPLFMDPIWNNLFFSV